MNSGDIRLAVFPQFFAHLLRHGPGIAVIICVLVIDDGVMAGLVGSIETFVGAIDIRVGPVPLAAVRGQADPRKRHQELAPSRQSPGSESTRSAI